MRGDFKPFQLLLFLLKITMMEIKDAALSLRRMTNFAFPDITKIEEKKGKIHLTVDTERSFQAMISMYRARFTGENENPLWEGYELSFEVKPAEEELNDTFLDKRPFEVEEPIEKTLRVQAAIKEKEEAEKADVELSKLIGETLDDPSKNNIKKLEKAIGGDSKIVHEDGKLIVSGKHGVERVYAKRPGSPVSQKELNDAIEKAKSEMAAEKVALLPKDLTEEE